MKPHTSTALTDLADLALLDVTSLSYEEQATLNQALLRTTTWVAELMAVPTDGVQTTVQPFTLPTMLRSDTAAPDVNATHVLALAPDRHGDLFRVPRVIGTQAPEDHTDVPDGNYRPRTQGHD